MSGWSRHLSAQHTCSLLCAHRLADRMAWHWLALAPFLLTAGEDFVQWLAQVGRRCWSCFQMQHAFQIV